QISISAVNDLAFLHQLAARRRPVVTFPRGAGVSHDRYTEAASAKSFYRHGPADDPTGVFSAAESSSRLFEQQPQFDREASYGLEDDISSLVDTYFACGDTMLSDKDGYSGELMVTAARLRPLPARIKAILVIPAYQEEAAIAQTLRRYTSCAGMD